MILGERGRGIFTGGLRIRFIVLAGVDHYLIINMFPVVYMFTILQREEERCVIGEVINGVRHHELEMGWKMSCSMDWGWGSLLVGKSVFLMIGCGFSPC